MNTQSLIRHRKLRKMSLLICRYSRVKATQYLQKFTLADLGGVLTFWFL
jgi:hypothetical protein